MSNRDQIDQMKQEFQFTLSKVSHEVRNPVTIINSYLQLMEEKHPEVVDFEYWEDIQENMSYLMNLLEELSTYNNAQRLHLESVNLNEFLDSIAKSMSPTLDYLSITLHCNYEPNLPKIMIDKTKLQEAILNIIRNSFEAMEKGGCISIQTTLENHTVIISISDNGPGISPEYLEDLFTPFVTHKKEGTGLGLAIAKEVLDAHGGDIQVASSLEGATFQITLPTNI